LTRDFWAEFEENIFFDFCGAIGTPTEKLLYVKSIEQ
jgi:hypothetical protein